MKRKAQAETIVLHAGYRSDPAVHTLAVVSTRESPSMGSGPSSEPVEFLFAKDLVAEGPKHDLLAEVNS